jgi:hypothetical protein
VNRNSIALLGLSVLLVLTVAIPFTRAADKSAELFGPDKGVIDDGSDVYAWFEEGATFRWGAAPEWASYCDILAVNASENAENYSISVTFDDNVNISRIATRFAGVRVFVNMTQVPLSERNATLELVYGGNIYSSGEASNALSYAQVKNATYCYNATNIVNITGAVVNFSFPLTLPYNVTEFQGSGVIESSVENWSVVVWAWDFFDSTTALKNGNLIWDGYGDPEFRTNWGDGGFTFPGIGAFDLIALGAAIALGILVIRKRMRLNGRK